MDPGRYVLSAAASAFSDASSAMVTKSPGFFSRTSPAARFLKRGMTSASETARIISATLFTSMSIMPMPHFLFLMVYAFLVLAVFFGLAAAAFGFALVAAFLTVFFTAFLTAFLAAFFL